MDPNRCMTAGRWANVPAGDVFFCAGLEFIALSLRTFPV